MYSPTPEQQTLMSQAEAYLQIEDVYHAVKVLKLLVKKAPDWLAPYLQLAQLFKKRKEWKALVHYYKKAVALDPSLQDAWWDLSIGAYAIGKRRQAERIWNKFGWQSQQLASVLSVQIAHHGIFELIWVKPITPVSGHIISIPHPQSDRSFRDVIIYDRQICGYNIINQEKVPVYQELDIHKRSYFNTFSGIVYGASEQDIELFNRLALDQGIGFEVWSNAIRGLQMTPKEKKPEYYQKQQLFSSEQSDDATLVALSGRNKRVIHKLINAWQVISLKEVHELEQHH